MWWYLNAATRGHVSGRHKPRAGLNNGRLLLGCWGGGVWEVITGQPTPTRRQAGKEGRKHREPVQVQFLPRCWVRNSNIVCHCCNICAQYWTRLDGTEQLPTFGTWVGAYLGR
jgi:hypothetical protein